MSMIEGIGDEVIHFLAFLVIAVLALIAWWSTSISEGPLIRTVLILERRSRSRTTNDSNSQPPISTLTGNGSTIDTGQVDPTVIPELVENETNVTNSNDDKEENESGSSLLLPNNQQPSVQPVINSANDQIHAVPVPQPQPVSSSDDPVSSVDGCSPQRTTQETESSVNNTNDADSSVLRKRRLAFFQSRGPTLIESPDLADSESVSTAVSNNSSSNEHISSVSSDNIRIRLKYLNDDQIVVDGRLQEQLGDFKRRHFSIELAAEKMVRLIFNGQVLQSDSQTLQGYGLFDNCVVHCLVHNQRNASPRSAQPQTNGASNQSTPPEWNLSTLLYTILSVMLGFAWYCRYQYSHLFTVTTTAALFGLTGMFAVSLLSVYLPDHDTIQ